MCGAHASILELECKHYTVTDLPLDTVREE